MLRAFLSVLVFACSVQAACIGVEGREILAGDLAKADAAFAKLNPAIGFSYAPVAGSQRTVSGAEIDRWAAAHGIEGMQSSDVCFERTARVLNRQDVLETLTRLFGAGYRDLQIEIFDVCSCDIPPGRLQFTIEGATPPPAAHPETPALWRGRLITQDGAEYPVWARVRVLASLTVVRAAKTLQAHQVLTKQDVVADNVTASPLAFHEAQSIATYEGKIMNTSVTRGSVLRSDLVHSPCDVERGSVVAVSVSSGSARLVLEARADTAGNVGQQITVRNPVSAATFQARVTGPGRAEIVLAPAHFADVPVGPLARRNEGTVSGGGL